MFAAAGSVVELARMVKRRRWPETRVRGDSGFCRDDIMAWCEDNEVDYLLGLNTRLTARVDRQLCRSRHSCRYASAGACRREGRLWVGRFCGL